ncbi:MAG: DNA-directed RNA polymerase subunit omega [Oscillospiraceae bacterium]|nr:DNA-directed RNA polymerase subunit omega [Oscillospiraceae bacterium]
MIYPDINDLIQKVDSRYTLVVTAAKRARQLVDGSDKITKFDSDKAVTIAIHEIAEGKISYTRELSEGDK